MSAPGEALADLGPVLPPRGEVYRRLSEIERRAGLARSLAIAGPYCDLGAAVRELQAIAALAGTNQTELLGEPQAARHGREADISGGVPTPPQADGK